MFNQSVVPTPHQAAEVRYVFDEEKALAECKELIARRDEAKGEFKDTIVEIGKRLLEARRAWPDERLPQGGVGYSKQLRTFIAKLGIEHNTGKRYMSYARDPSRLAENRRAVKRYAKSRVVALREMLTAYDGGATPEEIFTAIREELKEHGKAA
jgi:hypothetical protein